MTAPEEYLAPNSQERPLLGQACGEERPVLQAGLWPGAPSLRPHQGWLRGARVGVGVESPWDGAPVSRDALSGRAPR